MAGKYSNYDLLPDGKVIIKAKTTKGFVFIEKYPSFLVAMDDNNNEIAKTYKVNECGFNWIKKECRGWHDWNRLNWKIELK